MEKHTQPMILFGSTTLRYQLMSQGSFTTPVLAGPYKVPEKISDADYCKFTERILHWLCTSIDLSCVHQASDYHNLNNR